MPKAAGTSPFDPKRTRLLLTEARNIHFQCPARLIRMHFPEHGVEHEPNRSLGCGRNNEAFSVLVERELPHLGV
jgi:hypothetical protein